MIDRDKGETYSIGDSNSNTLSYDNAGRAMAFMVFNPSKAGIVLDGSVEENEIWRPYEGDQMFASFASQSVTNDDWMISPELPGSSQEISFYVRSVLEDYIEQYEILYSTTGDDVNDFIKIGGTRNAPAIAWTEVKVVLPEGAKYFAIHCISDDKFAFLVDNIKYLPQSAFAEELSLIGYNIYCNKEKLNDEPVEEMTFTHTLTDTEQKDYYVTAVYDKGESQMSNVVSINISGVESISKAMLNIFGGNGVINIVNAANKHINVFATDGKLIASKNATSDNYQIAIGKGFYIAIVNNKAYRIIVK